jgi:hypothetical protein
VPIYDLNENEEPGAVAGLGQMLMAVTALVAIVTNRIANVGVMTPTVTGHAAGSDANAPPSTIAPSNPAFRL